MPPAIDVIGLRKVSGDLAAVDDLDLRVETGEIFGLLGPNGAGKTTTLELIEGLRAPDAGTIRVLGEAPWPRNPGLLRRIGVQLQSRAFFEKLTAREQLRTFADPFGASPNRPDDLLALVGLTESADVRTGDMSGGQAQRLSIACALVHEPELVFLDEPTGALDPQSRRNLWDTIRQIREDGATVVLTTHSMEEAEELCDRVAIMDAGRILVSGRPATLVRDLEAPVRISLPADAVPTDDARHLPGVASATITTSGLTLNGDDAGEILVGLAHRGLLDGLQVRGATLEDVFLEVTGREYRA